VSRFDAAENLARYQEHGCSSRTEYLQRVSEDYGVALDAVEAVAQLLGPNEDFDGLISMVQDMDEGLL